MNFQHRLGFSLLQDRQSLFKIDLIKILFMKKVYQDMTSTLRSNFKSVFNSCKDAIEITWFYFSITVNDLHKVNYFKPQFFILKNAINFGRVKRRQITSKTINRIFCKAKNRWMERSIMWRKITINREHKEKLNGSSLCFHWRQVDVWFPFWSFHSFLNTQNLALWWCNESRSPLIHFNKPI